MDVLPLPQPWIDFFTGLSPEAKVDLFEALWHASTGTEQGLIIGDIRTFFGPTPAGDGAQAADAGSGASAAAGPAPPDPLLDRALRGGGGDGNGSGFTIPPELRRLAAGKSSCVCMVVHRYCGGVQEL